MSLEAVAAVLTADVDHADFRVLVHLADQADEYHVAVPVLPKLAELTRLDLNELQIVLRRLVDRGILEAAGESPYDWHSRSEGFRIRTAEIPSLDRTPFTQPADFDQPDA